MTSDAPIARVNVGRSGLLFIERRAGQGWTQTDVYDVSEYVKIAADRAAAWFEETL